LEVFNSTGMGLVMMKRIAIVVGIPLIFKTPTMTITINPYQCRRPNGKADLENGTYSLGFPAQNFLPFSAFVSIVSLQKL
jgi:hypothetical protein